jgi:NAD(P)-dependent dehydrogenase (short-subunit alcohol dehydrogenase family)
MGARGLADDQRNAETEAEDGRPGMIEATEPRFGRLDVMVVNAGVGILCKAVEGH